MVTRSEADEDARELAAWRKANGVPEPKSGRPPLRKTPKGASYRQGRPRVPAAPVQAGPAQATDAPAPAGNSGPDPLRGGSGSPSGVRVQAGKVGHGVAGVAVGLFAWGFALNYIRGGWAQAAGWFGAKFFNEPFGASSSTSASSSSSSGSGTPGNGKPQAAAQAQGRPNPASVASRF